VDLASLFSATLTAAFGALFLLWLLSLALRDASIVDIWWGPGFALIAATAYVSAPGGHSDRQVLSLVLVSAPSTTWVRPSS
jgi:steroid 5-alpha reductase family enzyme